MPIKHGTKRAPYNISRNLGGVHHATLALVCDAVRKLHPATVNQVADPVPWVGIVDIVAAGFPCQPVSCAGMRLGIDDPRWLLESIETTTGISTTTMRARI